MKPSAEKIIEELLHQNSTLRLEHAVLSSALSQQREIEEELNKQQDIPEEALEILSKLDIK